MTSDELMRLSAEKALRELSWESIEFLFRPSNMLELLLRIDFQGMRKKIGEWCATDAPDAMAHRFRRQYIPALLGAVRREEFFREMQERRGTPNVL